MPVTCLVWSCKSKGNMAGISFHRLGNVRYASWLNAIGRSPEENISSTGVICSKHFVKTDYVVKRKRAILKTDAVPKLFLPPNAPSTSKPNPSPRYLSLTGTSLPLQMNDGNVVSSDGALHPQVLTSSSDSAGLKGVQKRNRKLVKKFHTYAASPEVYKTRYMNERTKNRQLRYKHQLEREKAKRLRNKVSHLKQIVNDIKKKDLLSPGAYELLEQTFSGVPLAVMKRMLANSRRGKTVRQKYDNVIRSFAMTLQFYSSKAYEYVRKTFNLALPSQRVIRGWFSNIICEPGFSQPAFDSLKAKVAEYKARGQTLLCSLMFDEMSIKKHIDLYDGKSWGYVNVGANALEDDRRQYATEAFVLMVVAVNGHWKLPIAYFFIDGLNAEERANIVKEALIQLHECGVIITSLSCDGPNVNFTMMGTLGAKVASIDGMQPYFLHPVDQRKIYIIFDICHMIKLIRNNWATLGRFVDPANEIVDFNYVTMLHHLQEQEGLRFGTKLKTAHMNWRQQKMKVNLAVQTISESVAAAIEFLMVDMQDIRFRDAAPTIKFIRLIDQLFDLLNSRNPTTVRMKMPLAKRNEALWKPVMEDAVDYLSKLKTLENVKLINSQQRTGFKGFIISTLSVIQIYKKYVENDSILKYVLTYKFSTDHLELFFCSIRARNGWNNNPSALQFFHSYRRLLLHHDIKNLSGNCTAQDDTNILYTTKQNNKTQVPLQASDIQIMRKYKLEEHEAIIHDHDYSIPVNIPLSEISENVITYVAGYAVNMSMKLIKCPTCIEALYNSKLQHGSLKLLLRKRWGTLTIPSEDTISVCKQVEIMLRKVLLVSNNELPGEGNFLQTFVIAIHSKLSLNRNLFKDIEGHNLQYLTLEENHISRIIKTLSLSYLKIRLFHVAKSQSYKIKGRPIRKQMSKLILFSHQ